MPVVVRFRPIAQLGLLWLFYLGALLFTALPQGLNTPNPECIDRSFHFGLLANSDQWIQALGPTDAASCARAALELVTQGRVTTPFYRTAWPPGIYLLHAVLRVLHAPVPLSFIFLTCCLWACVFLQFFIFARRRLPPLLAAGLPLVVLATRLMRLYFLHGWGMYNSEAFTCPFLLLGLGFLIMAFEPLVWPTSSAAGDVRRALGAGSCSGLCLVASAYFRAHAELVVAILSLAFIPAALVSIVVALRRSGWRPTALPQSLCVVWWKSGLLVLTVVLLVFHACTMPYRYLHNYRQEGTWQWCSGYSYCWAQVWQGPRNLPDEDDFELGGGFWPVFIAPDWHVDAARLTPEQGRALTLKLIRKRPIAFLRYKLPILGRFWLMQNAPGLGKNLDWLENGTLLLSLLIAVGSCVIGLFRTRTAGPALWLLAFTGCVVAASVGPSMVFHFETRYLFPIKVVGFLLLPYWVLLINRRGAVGRHHTEPLPGPELPGVAPPTAA
ncbi:MAG TPA: hypothetical protein VH592_13925 [Gemmataceae bacterium]|jgi:hypothetical protein